MPRTIQVQIPEDADVNSTLCFLVDGQELELAMPPGAKPGDCIELEIGTHEDAGAGGFGEPDTIELGHNIRLALCTELSVGGDGTAGYIWGAGRRLAAFLASHKELVQGRRVIELGS